MTKDWEIRRLQSRNRRASRRSCVERGLRGTPSGRRRRRTSCRNISTARLARPIAPSISQARSCSAFCGSPARSYPSIPNWRRGRVPKTLVWDSESSTGQHHRLTVCARDVAGTLGTRIYQTAARDPEAKGVVERANGFLETSLMSGHQFASTADYNTQLAGWLPRGDKASDAEHHPHRWQHRTAASGTPTPPIASPRVLSRGSQAEGG